MSSYGSVMEDVSILVDSHIKNMDMLQKCSDITVDKNALLIQQYGNIPHEDG